MRRADSRFRSGDRNQRLYFLFFYDRRPCASGIQKNLSTPANIPASSLKINNIYKKIHPVLQKFPKLDTNNHPPQIYGSPHSHICRLTQDLPSVSSLPVGEADRLDVLCFYKGVIFNIAF